MKRDSLDALWSLCIRTRDRFTCRRCGKQHDPKSQGLHAAHIFGRGKMSTRFDLLNGVALCYGCHRFLDTHPDEKTRWVLSWMQQPVYDRLLFRAHQPSKVDRVLVRIHLTQFLSELTQGGN